MSNILGRNIRGLVYSILLLLQFGVYGQNSSEKLSLDQAISIAIAESPEIKLQQQRLAQSQASVQQAQGAFDYNAFGSLQLSQDRRNVLPLPIPTDFDRILYDTFGVRTVATNFSSINAGVSRQLRNGMFVQTSINTGRILNDIPFPDPFQQFTSRNATSARLQVGVPLLKNRGGKISQAPEKAAEQLALASAQHLQFATVSQILSAVLAYWNYQAATRSLVIYQQAEERAKTVLAESQLLIDAEKKPAADLAQISSEVAVRTSQRLLAAQALFQAQQLLGQAMGIDYQASALLGAPSSLFPALESMGNIDSLSVEALLEKVIEGRPDLLAQKQWVAAQETMAGAAQQNKLPSLNANVFIQHSGLQYGTGLGNYLSPFTASQGRTIDYGASISLSVPLQNNAAKGSAARELAVLREQQIGYDNELRKIMINISIAINQLKVSKDILKQSQISYEKAGETFENERVKYQQGLSTLFNLILFQERLTLAELNYIAAQNQFAQSIAILRFESGTIGNNPDAQLFQNIPSIQD